MIRVVLPYHLRVLAKLEGEAVLDVVAPVTLGAVIDALEAGYPGLRGTIRDYGARTRRPMIRFYACQEDISHEPLEAVLPGAVASGDTPLYVVGAIAGG